MELLLAKDGIFPITKDSQGKLLGTKPVSGLNIAGTVQGEGKLNGVPSLFVRLAGCNLRCSWKTPDIQACDCDTAYAAYKLDGSYKLSTTEIADILFNNLGNITHIVITGGEPFLQAKPLSELCRYLKSLSTTHITVETNATIFDSECVRNIDFFSLSPKLSSSTPVGSFAKKHDETRVNIKTIQYFINSARLQNKDFQLKFVYSNDNDIKEINLLLKQIYGWHNEDILLMPLGANIEQLEIMKYKTLEHCIRNGWRYCDRLHISLFGNKIGV